MATMFTTYNRMPEGTRRVVVDILNTLLADTTDLWAQTKHAHWNVQGEEFFMWHELFDEIAEPLTGFADDIAERATALGGFAQGTLRMAAMGSTLPEVNGSTVSGEDFLAHLIDLYATHGQNLRTAIRMCCDMDVTDEVTSNMLQDQCHQIDKSLYFLERHVILPDEDDAPLTTS